MIKNENVIYIITNKTNGKSYIGSAVNFKQRKSKHLSSLNKNSHHNKYLQRSWNKYSCENFIFEIVDQVDEPEQLIEREQWWIDSFVWDNLYNLYPTAGSPFGRKVSEATKSKISKSNIGRKHTEETKRKMSKSRKGNAPANLGVPHTEETKEKISKANSGENHWNYGGNMSDKSITKMIENMPHKKSVVQIDKNTNEIISIFCSVSEAARKTEINRGNISRVCLKAIKPNGYQCKTAGGYKWRFVEDTE